MQLVNRSKFVIIAVISCSLLLAWFPNLKKGNSFSDIISISQEEESSVWDEIGSKLNMDHKTHLSRVQAEIRKLLADKEELHRILKAAGPYIYYISKEIEARDLPAELALIPIIESEFNPMDHSSAGATGLWQLMPQTARELGVKVKSQYDGRKNVVASTKAALAYFNDLGNYFNGNWYLAIAAYNCGQVKVASLQRRTGTNNYWNLPVPQETKLYVPKLLAVAAIIKNPEKYGVELPQVANKPYFSAVKVKKPVTLEKVAKTSDINITTLQKLNPDMKHGTSVPEKGGAYTVLVPVQKAPVVQQKLSVQA